MNKKYEALIGALVVVYPTVFIIIPAKGYSATGLDLLYASTSQYNQYIRCSAPAWWLDGVLRSDGVTYSAYEVAVPGLGKQDEDE